MFLTTDNDAHTVNVLATQITAGAAIAWFVNLMKRSPYMPWISEETKVLANGVKLVLSFVAALGVNVAWNGVDHTLVISGLTLTGILAAGWALAKQYTMTHLAGKWMYPETPAKPGA